MGEKIDNRKALARKIVDRIASDPDFRRQIVDSPQEALISAGFAQEIEELTDDVTGYSLGQADLLSGFGLLLASNPMGSNRVHADPKVYSTPDQEEVHKINHKRKGKNPIQVDQDGGGSKR
jgi:hypothetical protein